MRDKLSGSSRKYDFQILSKTTGISRICPSLTFFAIPVSIFMVFPSLLLAGNTSSGKELKSGLRESSSIFSNEKYDNAKKMFAERWIDGVQMIMVYWPSVKARNDIFQCIGLTDEQKKRASKIIDKYWEKYKKLDQEGRELMKDDSLTDEQKADRTKKSKFNERMSAIGLKMRKEFTKILPKEKINLLHDCIEYEWLCVYRNSER